MSFLDYATGFNAPSDVLSWIQKNLTDETPVTDGEHIIDYLLSDKRPKNITSMTLEHARTNAEKWVKAMVKKGQHIQEKPEDTEVVLDFKDGFKVVKLVGKAAFDREGYLMSHCVASYAGKDDEIYSLRDKDNMPHCTMSKSSQQIKGKGNGSIDPLYITYVVAFLEHVGMTVRDSEMQNLGYINVEKWKQYLSKDTIKALFNGGYHYMQKEQIGTDGSPFYCLDMLDQVPLVKETTVGLKVAFDLPAFIRGSCEFLFQRKTKKGASDKAYTQLASSGYSSQLASSGDYSKLASSGDYSKLAASGGYSQLASSGYSSKLAASGDYSQLASSGYSSKLAASGYSSQLASSGGYSQLASSGDYSKLAASGGYSQLAASGGYSQLASSGYSSQLASSGGYSKLAASGGYSQLAASGYYSQLASSGYSSKLAASGGYSQLASSGYSSKLAASGDYSQLASSGDSSQIESLGEHCVLAAIGINSRIKAKKGSWITLAEYDENYRPVMVKSAMIDGETLKEGVFYTLKGGEFIEADFD